jgi:16S rRNA (guanine527-N7)-methyltransferase
MMRIWKGKMGDDLSLEGRPPGSPLHLFVEYLHQFGLENVGATTRVAQFLRYRDELLDWNTRMNLTAITDPDEVLSKHFLDSLSLLQVYDQPRTRLLDIGSGPGFPGLALKIMRPAWHVTLLEATGKKVKFLQHMIETLQLQNIEAIHGRAEELAHQQQYRTSFDLVTARAVASLSTLLEYAAPFCRVGGQIILPKKGELTEELEQGKRAAKVLGVRLKGDIAVTLSGLDDGRRLLVWEQQKLCPAQYPRSGAAMAKKPLGVV